MPRNVEIGLAMAALVIFAVGLYILATKWWRPK